LGGVTTLKSLVAPEIETITGTFDSIERGKGISPFQLEYCFVCQNEAIYLELDPLSSNIIFDEEFIK